MGKPARCLVHVDERLAAVQNRLRAKKAAREQVAKDATGDGNQGLEEAAQDEHEEDREGADTNDYVDYVPRTQKQPAKPSKADTPDYAAAAAKANGMHITTRLRPFRATDFPSYDVFFQLWAAYLFDNFAMYRIRSSVTVASANKKKAAAFEERKALAALENEPFTEELELYPEELVYVRCRKVCTHGCKQAPRGTGARQRRRTRYTGCQAQITIESVFDRDTGEWKLQTKNQIVTHNHTMDEDVYQTYLTSSELTDPVLFKHAVSMIAADGKTRKILDFLNRISSRRITSRMLYNFWHYRLGGGTALDGFKRMIQQFADFFGSDCLLIEDQDGQVIGVVFQTQTQRDLYDMYGDTIQFDWTYNTNNVGYGLGAFVVTAASGHGVSVADFLATTQSKDMMRVMFQHFVSLNPTAQHKIKSFIIDKDYAEWAVLLEVFPSAAILLCQFHVMQWFKRVMVDPKYGIAVALRPDLVKCLQALVYAKTDEIFSRERGVLRDLLSAPQHRLFLQYMDERWYSCVAMWSDSRRKKTFDAFSPTNNNVESMWKQTKDGTGNHKRIDLCLEAIFQYATSVLQREKDVLVEFKTSSALRSACADYIRPLLADLSDYTADKVTEEWDLFASASPTTYSSVPVTQSLYTVYVAGSREPQVEVNTDALSCSCNFHSSSSLPCRHLFYVTAVVQKKHVYPAGAVPERWSLSSALHLLPKLTQGIAELSTLRVGLEVSAEAVGDNLSRDEFRTVSECCPSVAHFKLKRYEISDCVVLDDNEKRRSVTALLDPITVFLTGLGSAQFTACATEAGDAVAKLLARLKANVASTVDVFDTDQEEPNLLGSTDVGDLPPSAAHVVSPRAAGNVSPATADTTDDASRPAAIEIDAREGPTEPLPLPDSVPQAALYDALADLDRETSSVQLLDTSDIIPFSPSSPESFGTMVDRGSSHALRSVNATFATGVESLRNPELWQVSPFAGIAPAVPAASFQVVMERMAVTALLSPAVPIEIDATQREEDLPSDNVAENAETVGSRVGTSGRVLGSSSSGCPRPMDQPAAASYKRKADANGSGDVPKRAMLTNAELGRGRLSNATLPPVRQRGRTKTTKQVSKAKGREAFLDQTTTCPVYLDALRHLLRFVPVSYALLLLAQYPQLFTDVALTTKRARLRHEWVTDATHRFNFIIPSGLLKTIRAVMQTVFDKEDTDVVDTIEEADGTVTRSMQTGLQSVAYLVGAGDARGFSRDTVHALVDVAEAERKLKAWEADVKWLECGERWNPPDGATPVPFMQAEVDVVEGQLSTLGSVQVRAAVKERLRDSALGTVLYVSAPATTFTISLENVIGALGRTEWLSDSVVNFTLQTIAARVGDVVVIDSLTGTDTTSARARTGTQATRPPAASTIAPAQSSIPSALLSQTRVVCFPINYDIRHWCSVSVVFDWGTRRHYALLYDPTNSNKWSDRLTETWHTWCLPLIRNWWERDGCDEIGDITAYVSAKPKQTDGWNCGVFTIVHEYALMVNDSSFHRRDELTEFELDTVRVRLLWLILCASRSSIDTDQERVAKTNAADLAAFYRRLSH